MILIPRYTQAMLGSLTLWVISDGKLNVVDTNMRSFFEIVFTEKKTWKKPAKN